MVYILTPQNATFQYSNADAAFGGIIPPEGILGVLHKAEPLDGCEPLSNKVTPGDSAFVLIERGGCVFDVKVFFAQQAGFSAVIVFNNEFGRELITMSGRHASEIYIPAVFVTNNSGRQLLSVIGQPGTDCMITPTFDSTAWSVMAVSFISLLAVSAVVATFFFVRRHRLRRVGSRLLFVSQVEGMTSREVKALPSTVYKSGGSGNGTTETCAICLDDYETGDKLRVLPCDHEFHVACIDQWLTTRRPFCPVCKRDPRQSPSSDAPPSETTPLLGSLSNPNSESQIMTIGPVEPSEILSSPTNQTTVVNFPSSSSSRTTVRSLSDVTPLSP